MFKSLAERAEIAEIFLNTDHTNLTKFCENADVRGQVSDIFFIPLTWFVVIVFDHLPTARRKSLLIPHRVCD